MFNILKWIFWLSLSFLVIYVLFLVYKNIKNQNVDSDLNGAISNFFSNFNIKINDNLISATTAKDFFTPRYVAPLTVVPGPGWYENMNALYQQIYLNNLNNLEANNFFNNHFNNFYTGNNLNTQSNMDIDREGKLQLLFPSSWMENLKY